METQEHIAKAAITILAPVDQVWKALTDPQLIKKYMFDTDVETDWQEGSDITWKGSFNGKPFEDKGKILKLVPNETLQYDHISPGGETHTVTIQLTDNLEHTGVTLTQDRNKDEAAKAEAEKNWGGMLSGMKKLLES